MPGSWHGHRKWVWSSGRVLRDKGTEKKHLFHVTNHPLLFRYLHAPFDPNQQAGLPLPLPTHPYRTIGCVFNDKYFYANCQPSDNITTCRFELQNTSHWKALSTEAIRYLNNLLANHRYINYTKNSARTFLIQMVEIIELWIHDWLDCNGASLSNSLILCRSVSGVGSCNFCPPVLPPVGDSALAANEIETQLRTLTFQHREVSCIIFNTITNLIAITSRTWGSVLFGMMTFATCWVLHCQRTRLSVVWVWVVWGMKNFRRLYVILSQMATPSRVFPSNCLTGTHARHSKPVWGRPAIVSFRLSYSHTVDPR